MEKKLIILITLSLMFACNNNNIISEDYNNYNYKRYGLNCPVKSIDVRTYEATSKFGEIVKKSLGDIYFNYEYGNYSAIFNSKGNIESFKSYDHKGNIMEETKYTYDDNGRLIECMNYFDVLFYEKCIYEYDGKFVVKSTETLFSKNGPIGASIIITYKNNGKQIIEENRYVGDTTIYDRTYNKEIIWKNDKESEYIINDFVSFYVIKGREIRNDDNLITEKNEEEIALWNTKINLYVEYNNKNLPIYIKNCNINSILECKEPSFPESFPEYDNIYYIEYEYDKKGNWIKQIVYEGENKRPYTISERVINY